MDVMLCYVTLCLVTSVNQPLGLLAKILIKENLSVHVQGMLRSACKTLLEEILSVCTNCAISDYYVEIFVLVIVFAFACDGPKCLPLAIPLCCMLFFVQFLT